MLNRIVSSKGSAVLVRCDLSTNSSDRFVQLSLNWNAELLLGLQPTPTGMSSAFTTVLIHTWHIEKYMSDFSYYPNPWSKLEMLFYQAIGN